MAVFISNGMSCSAMSVPIRSGSLRGLLAALSKKESGMTETFNDADRELLGRTAFATLALVLPDGSLQNSIMWYRADGDGLRMIAPAASAKARALRHSPHVSIVINEPGNPYDYLEIRGRADILADDAGARSELRDIAKRYIGDRADAYVDALSDAPRVIIAVQPDRVRRHRATPPSSR